MLRYVTLFQNVGGTSETAVTLFKDVTANSAVRLSILVNRLILILFQLQRRSKLLHLTRLHARKVLALARANREAARTDTVTDQGLRG